MNADTSRAQSPGSRRNQRGSDARRWWALVAISASVLVVGLDLTVLNLALPVLSTQLHAPTTDLQWFSASYSLVLAAALLPAGLLGDRAGRKNAADRAGGVRGQLGRLRVRRVPGRADRGPRGPWPRRRGDLPDVDRRAAGAIRPGRAAPGDRGGDGCDVHRLPGRPAAGRVAAGQLLVGLGLPDQRPGGGDRPGRGGVPDAGVARGPGGRIDIPGIALSSAGLAGVAHGCIKAGESGWSDPAALGPVWRAWPCWPASWPGSGGRGGTASRWSSWSCSARPASPGARS